MKYLLDASVFIQAKRMYYGFDFCPGFWEWIDNAHQQGKIHSVEKIGYELKAGNDELAMWAEVRDELFFLPPDEKTLKSLQVIAEWVTAADFKPAAISTFLQDPDYYLIAHAHAYSLTLVTQEAVAKQHAPSRIKIPNVCISLGVKCVTPFEMLRSERVRLIVQK